MANESKPFRKPRPSDNVTLVVTAHGPALVGYCEIFEHTTWGLINITELREEIKKHPDLYPTIPVLIRDEDMANLDQYREIDMTRVVELTDAELEDPGIMVCDFSNDKDNLDLAPIDGHHRMRGRYDKGKREMLFYVVDHRVLEGFRPDMDTLIGEHAWGEKEIVDGVLKKVR